MAEPSRWSRWSRRETRWAYVFLLPWIIGFAVFQAGPMVASLALSFTEYDVLNPPRFAGAANYRQILTDPKVANALGNSVYYTLLRVPVGVALALALALLLSRVRRGAGFFRTLFYLPSMTPAVATGILFLSLLNGQVGLVNKGLELLGVQGPNWTTDPAWIKPSVVITTLWSVGATTIILFAAVQNVPKELYEAALVDGASAWHRFRRITLPMISSALFFVTIVDTINALQVFTEAYTMYFGNANAQESASDAASFFVLYLFQQAFEFLHMGYASALAWALFGIIAVITFVQVKVGNRLVYYEAEEH